MPPVPLRRVASPGRAQPLTIPAPTGGLNTVSSGTALPPGDCVVAWNLIAAENGLRSRLGYREWCTGLTGDADDKVRSVLSFAGSEPSQNRLFATTSSGIYPATSSVDGPTLAYTFASSANEAGYGVGRVLVTSGGHFYLYTDEENGLHVYSESGATWTAPAMGGGVGEIANVDPADLVHVTVFKNRAWYTERDSTSAWYLPAGSVYGSATEFDFGAQFKAGGHLVGLWAWTYDGGAGVDDSLVAVSSAGDVVVYQGADPDDPDAFQMRGTWNMGPPPTGRDIAYDVGGDLYLLSTVALLPISQLVVGAEVRRVVTEKIANLYNQLMITRREDRGWSMRLSPQDSALMVLHPDYDTEVDQQLVLAQGNRSWWRYRGLPMHSAEVWEGQLYFGTQDGRVCLATGYVDAVELADPTAYEKVDWTLISAFQKLGGAAQVRVSQIRALVVADGARPELSLEARYRYDTSEVSDPDVTGAAAGTWDNAVWDTDVWGGAASPYTLLRGAVGVGPEVALAIRGRSIDRTILVSLDAMAETGGWL